MDCRNSPGTVGLGIYIFDLMAEIKNSFFLWMEELVFMWSRSEIL